jgi:hypothetical protein
VSLSQILVSTRAKSSRVGSRAGAPPAARGGGAIPTDAGEAPGAGASATAPPSPPPPSPSETAEAAAAAAELRSEKARGGGGAMWYDTSRSSLVGRRTPVLGGRPGLRPRFLGCGAYGATLKRRMGSDGPAPGAPAGGW